MNIQIYLAKKIGVPFQEFDYETAKYELVWEGTAAHPGIDEILDDDAVLEIAFDKFNLDEKPEGYADDECALSIGDVISINYRTYLCDTISWKKLAKLNLVRKAFEN